MPILFAFVRSACCVRLPAGLGAHKIKTVEGEAVQDRDGAPRLVRVVEDGRLSYYKESATSSYWESVWDSALNKRSYRGAEKGRLGGFERAFTRWLPKEGRILEAGCGLAHRVLALRMRGYNVEGVDFAERTVQRVRELFPGLPIRAGDVTRLQVPDGYYNGYISLGVVEHRQQGPQPFLDEAYRLLTAGGVALISVPYFHALRRLKARWGLYRGTPAGLQFYQYAYSEEEIRRHVVAAGFQVEASMAYEGFKGIKDEIAGAYYFLRFVQGVPLLGWGVKRWLKHCWLGHMILLVCRKPYGDTRAQEAA